MQSKTQPPDDDWGKLRRIAVELRGKGRGWRLGFWKSFGGEQGIGALIGWLYHRGKCVYCGVDLVREGQMVGGAGTTDHLIPRGKSKIGFTSPFNAVPACACCNSIKGLLDRELKRSDYPDALNQVQHDRLISRARDFVAERRRFADSLFEKDKSAWDKALDHRNKLEFKT